jgi:hypothetical protein
MRHSRSLVILNRTVFIWSLEILIRAPAFGLLSVTKQQLNVFLPWFRADFPNRLGC